MRNNYEYCNYDRVFIVHNKLYRIINKLVSWTEVELLNQVHVSTNDKNLNEN